MAESSRAPGRIFISYRREETAYPAGWLFDRLADYFGGGQIFKDVDSIELGDDWVDKITTAVGSCDVLLALIGDQWLTITDENGRRRLEDPDDFVRVEIEAALSRNVRVIPILVDGAKVPRADEVPPSLAKLVRRQALELSPSRFDFDTGRLLKVLDKTLAEVRTEEEDALERAGADAPGPSSKGPAKAPEGAEPAGQPSAAAIPETPEMRVPPDKQQRRDSTRKRILAGIGVGVVIVALLIVAKIVADSSSNPQDDVSDSAAPVIFRDDFSDPASGWDDVGAEPIGGHFGSDVYRIYAETGADDEFAWGSSPETEELFPNAPPNLIIEVEAEKTAGGSDPNDGYGIFCRGKGDGNRDYSFIVGNGQVTIGKTTPDVPFTELDTGAIPTVDPDALIDLRAACTNVEEEQAVRLEFSINNEVVAIATDRDDPHLTGTVGLFVYTVETLEVEFDNFVVSEI